MSIEFLNFIAALVIIIIAAKASGYISTRLGQPAVLGELLAGIILGPTFLNMLGTWPVFHEDEHLGEIIQLMAEIGVVLLMFTIGLGVSFSHLKKMKKIPRHSQKFLSFSLQPPSLPGHFLYCYHSFLIYPNEFLLLFFLH